MNEVCPTCYGSGGIEVLEYSIGEIVTIPCPYCGGSGETTDVARIKQAERAKHYKKVLEHMQREIHKAAYEQAKRYKQALEHIQREIHKAIYAPKKQKWKSDFEREFESGKTRGLIQASDIVKEAIEVLEGEKMERYTNEQTARVVKYIIENIEALNDALDDALRVKEIEEQNKRYSEALEAIAYFDDKEEGEAATRIDAKYIARKALEGEK